jgi:hypothetical protein
MNAKLLAPKQLAIYAAFDTLSVSFNRLLAVNMPFTFFHPALILPARYLSSKWKRHVSITGLITGSVAPDFEKFLQMRGGNIYSHTLAGMFWFGLPVSMLLAVAFHLVIKETLIEYLPGTALSARFLAYKNQNWLLYLQRRYLAVVISILIGISSHLVLDSATHANGALVDRFPILSNYYEILFLNAQGYQLLEILYYMLSAIFICCAFVSLPQGHSQCSAKRKKALFWIGLITLSTLIIYLRLLVNPSIRHIWDLVSLTTGAGLISLFLFCLVWRQVA